MVGIVILSCSLFSNGCFGQTQKKETGTFAEKEASVTNSSNEKKNSKQKKQKPKSRQIWMVTSPTCIPCYNWKKNYIPILKKYGWKVGTGPYVDFRYVTAENIRDRFPKQMPEQIPLPHFVYVVNGKIYRQAPLGVGQNFNFKHMKALVAKKKNR